VNLGGHLLANVARRCSGQPKDDRAPCLEMAMWPPQARVGVPAALEMSNVTLSPPRHVLLGVLLDSLGGPHDDTCHLLWLFSASYLNCFACVTPGTADESGNIKRASCRLNSYLDCRCCARGRRRRNEAWHLNNTRIINWNCKLN